MRRTLPLAYSVLAAVVDRRQCEEHGMNYAHDNCEEISTDTGFILAQITKSISK